MREIERDIIAAIENGKDLKRGKCIYTYGYCLHDEVSGGIAYLMGTRYAVKRDNTLMLGVNDGAWKTRTTKSRINAFSQYYKLPRISQKDFKWNWSDGVPYTGRRLFNLEATK